MPVLPRLFVYGSLKRGLAHHGELEGAVFEDEVETAPGYALYLVGNYPAMVCEGRARVRGELYRIGREHLVRLDAFEGCPTLYQRASVRLADGNSALAYFMSASAVVGLPRLGRGAWSPPPVGYSGTVD